MCVLKSFHVCDTVVDYATLVKCAAALKDAKIPTRADVVQEKLDKEQEEERARWLKKKEKARKMGVDLRTPSPEPESFSESDDNEGANQRKRKPGSHLFAKAKNKKTKKTKKSSKDDDDAADKPGDESDVPEEEVATGKLELQQSAPYQFGLMVRERALLFP